MRPLLLALLLTFAGTAAARDLWHNSGDSMLPPDRAFALMPVEAHEGTLHVQWEVAPGYYLYRGRLKFEAIEPVNAKLTAPQIKRGEKLHDEHFGDVEIYRAGTVDATLTADRPVQRIKLTWQGCAEIGVCLPPVTRVVDVVTLP